MDDQSIVDCESWLPPQFLEDDPPFDDFDSSDLSSPVVSFAGSGEEWSDEEDQLKKKMAYLSLEHSNSKGSSDSGSPKSILRRIGGGRESRKKSPPPSEAVNELQSSDAWPNLRTTKSGTEIYPHWSFSQPQMHSFPGSTHHRMIRPQICGWDQVVAHSHVGPLGQEWPTLHQAAHQKNHRVTHKPETMRAVFLGLPGTRPSNGTGVFLPRQAGCRPEPRKKPLPPVLIPAKVVRALNLRFERMGSLPQQQPRPLSSSKSNMCYAPQSGKGSHKAQTQTQTETQPNYEVINLPQEWTY